MGGTTTTENGTLIIVRYFDAPREKVWRAWTEPERMKKWWGPKDFTAPSVTIDLKVGGKYLYCMRGRPAPEAPVQDFWGTGTYKEIVPTERLVVTDSFADEKGNVISAEHYGMQGFPLELEVAVTFEDAGENPPSHKASDGHSKTKMTLEHKGLPKGTMAEMTGQGWNQSFDKLAVVLRGK